MSPSRSIAQGSMSTYRRSGTDRGGVPASGAVPPSRPAVPRLAAFLDAIRRAPPAIRSPAHAPARLRLQAGQRRRGHPRLAGVAGALEHPAHRTHADAVQEFLAGGGLICRIRKYQFAIVHVTVV